MNYKIDASQDTAFIVDADTCCDVAYLRRLADGEDGNKFSTESPMSDDEWQRLLDVVHAAPDLLRELQSCVDYYGPMAVMDDSEAATHDRIILNAMAAIAKATGSHK